MEGLFPLLVFFLSFTGKIGCTFVLLGTALGHCLEGEVVESSGFLFDLVQPTGIRFAVVEPMLFFLLDMAGLDCLMAGNWGLAEMDRQLEYCLMAGNWKLEFGTQGEPWYMLVELLLTLEDSW